MSGVLESLELLHFCDDLYRIEEQEFQSLLDARFGVHIVASSHKFKVPPHKIGATDRIAPFGNANKLRALTQRVTQKGPISIFQEGQRIAYHYDTERQVYEVHFAGPQASSAESVGRFGFWEVA
jgi:hypothetical protein